MEWRARTHIIVSSVPPGTKFGFKQNLDVVKDVAHPYIMVEY